MALAITLETTYSAGNPIELLYLNNVGTDSYMKLIIKDGATEIYTGVYYEDSNSRILIDIEPILTGYVSNKEFNIKTASANTSISNGFKLITIETYRSSAGVYTIDAGSNWFYLMPQSLTNQDFLKFWNNLPYGNYENALKISQGNNMLYNALSAASTNTQPIASNVTGISGTSTNVNYTFTNDIAFITWQKTLNDESRYSIEIPVADFTIGDTLYLHLNINFWDSSYNTINDSFLIDITENSSGNGDTLNKTYTISPTVSNVYRSISIPFTLTDSEITSIKLSMHIPVRTIYEGIMYINAAGTRLNISNWYLGINPVHTYEPNTEQITYMGQNAARSGVIESPEIKKQDFILNDFNQYYSNTRLTYIDLVTYLSTKQPIKTLRNAPLNIQLISHRGIAELGKISAQLYGISNTITNYGSIEVLNGYYNSTVTPTMSSIGFNINNLGVDSNTVINTTHILLNIDNLLGNVSTNAYPTYGRRLIFELKDFECYKGNVYQLYYLNRRGGIDWIVLEGNNMKSEANTSNTYISKWRTPTSDTTIGGDLSTIVKPKYNVNISTSYTLNSDILNDFEYNKLNDLVSSPKLWLYDAQDNDTYAVECVDTNFTSKQRRFDKMFNFTINVRRQLNNIRNQF